jgi:hypothetical protein
VTPSAALTKEVRALLPACAAIVAALVFSIGAPDALRLRLVMLVLAFGSITLGGLAFGHEYTCRTLTLLLAQPIDRRRTCATKLAALVAMVALLCLAAVLSAPGRPFQMFSAARGEARAMLIMAPLCGICLAPALSMLCRSALAGAVFTVAIPGLLMLIANIIATAWYGFVLTDAVNAFISTFVWRGVFIACAAGAIATWVLFVRLEAIEGHAELQWPRRLRGDSSLAAPRKVPGALTALVRKELRLQQMTFVVVGLFILASAALWMLSRVNPEFWEVPIEAVAVLYGALLVVLIGSVASAEERQLGTLSSQLLLPIAARTQWAVKVATTLSLALVLGVGVPMLVTFLFSYSEEPTAWQPRLVKETLAAAVLLTTCSLYVSSLSSSAVRAMVNSIPVVIAGTVFVSAFAALVISIGYRVITDGDLLRSFETSSRSLYIWLAVLVAAMFLWFAFSNHRSMERRAPRVALQVLALVITAACCLALPLFLYTS